MAYGLKYKASKTHENGDKYEVRIYRDGWAGASYGIGNLTRLSLSIQGDRAALTAPIIKTSLNIGMIDTPDKGSTKSDGTTCVDANGDKVGKWEEFYTNNPTLYKVELRYTGALTRNAVIWTGFLTPDSWGEDMTYGGTISLVARDMLGTLSEYEFDLTGDVTITQIVQGALTKCKCAMTATMRTSECLQNAGNSQSILTAKINASTFAGKSWYEALEQTLEGVGLILRYDGNNGFDCTSIRYAASHAVEGGENAHTPAFYNRSGYRTLDPAVKQIVEVFNPSIESIAPVEPGADDWTDTGQTLTQKFKNHLGQESTYSYPKMSLSVQGVDYSGTGALPYYENTYIYNGTTGELIPTFRAPLYIPINLQSSADFLTLKNAAFVPPFNLSFSNPMGSTGYLLFTPAEGSSPRVLTNTYSRDFEQKVRFRITCKKNGTTYYWDTSGAGVWGTTEKVLEYVTGERIQVAELEGATDYAIGVNTIVVPAPASATDFYPARAAFIPLVYEVAPIDGNDVYGEYKTTTIYDEENHIEINRTPSIGAINSSTPAAFLPNVLHYGTTPASDKWRWAGENSAGLPLAVVIHQQLLVFNCAQNGNSIFTGDLLDLTSRVSVPGTNYDYFTRSCALLAGDYNCLSGYIEGVTLREIYDWDDVWDGVTPEYTEKESQAKGGTAASGGGGSSSGGGGGSSHTHPNKAVLDGITEDKVTDWDEAYTHSQIGAAASTPSGNPHNTTLAQIKKNSSTAIGDDLAAKMLAVAELFEKDTTSVSGQTLIKAKFSLYSEGEITAGGVGSGGSTGGGLASLWALTGGSDVRLYDTETMVAKFGIKVNGNFVTPSNGIFNISTSEGTVQSVKMNNGTPIQPDANGVVNLGTVITAHQSLAAYRTSANQDTIDNAIKGRLTTIEGLIPSAATTSNQLADKSFVNSSIATATATFRGTSASGLTEAQFLAWANGLTKDNNDYVFWNTTDSAGNVQFKRYKYNGTSWAYEYTLNNSSFTAAQWAAVNSGITSSLVTAFGNKYDKPSSGIPLTDLAQGVKDSLALADSALQSHQTIYALTVQKNGTTVGTYTPNSAAKTINIQDVASAQTLSDLKTWIESMFEKDTTSVSGQTLIKAKFSLYSEGEITAGGVGSGGGGGGGLASVYFNNTRADDGETAKFGIKINGSWAAVQTDSTYGKYININTATGVTAIKVNGGAAQTGEVSLTIPSAYTLPIATASTLGGIKVGANLSINASTGVLSATDTTYSDATTSAHGLMSAADKTKLNGIATGATAVTESTVSGWGFTKNTGTVTQVKVGTAPYDPVSGVVSLPAYPTKLSDLTDDVVSGHYQPLDADLTAIAALTGTSGHLKKTAANTWTLDTDVATKTYVGGALSPYRTSANQDTIDNLLASCVQSLQSQIDSVAARDSFDELTATSLFADMLAASSIYGTLHGNADTATNATNASHADSATNATNASYLVSNTHAAGSATNPVYFTGGRPSTCSYSFGNGSGNAALNNGTLNTNLNADMLDGVHATGLFTALASSAATNLSATIGGTTKSIALYATYDTSGQNITSNFTAVSQALQSLQSQVDSVAARSSFDELVSSAIYVDTLSAKDGLFSGNLNCVDTSQSVGTSAKPWGAFYGNRWYPKANDTTHYIEYTNDGFLIHGNIIATGEVTAGA